jgi:hypothetical protein
MMTSDATTLNHILSNPVFQKPPDMAYTVSRLVGPGICSLPLLPTLFLYLILILLFTDLGVLVVEGAVIINLCRLRSST